MKEVLSNPFDTVKEGLFEESLKRLCYTELSLSQIRDLVLFCEERGCENMYSAYEAFITDVPEQDREKDVDLTFLDKAEFGAIKHWSDHSDKGFEHIRFFVTDEKTDDEISPDIYGRLYISPTLKNLPVLAQSIIKKHQEKDRDLLCKISKTGSRNDRVVIYLKEDFNDELEILKEIQNESPDVFTNCIKNKLWCNINGVNDIYFGSNPLNIGASYGECRAKAIGEILELKKSGLIDINNDDELDQVYNLACLSWGVNPFNYGFSVDDVSVRRAAHTVLSGYKATNREVWKNSERYKKRYSIVDEWLKQNSAPAEKTWLGDGIPKFQGI